MVLHMFEFTKLKKKQEKKISDRVKRKDFIVDSKNKRNR